MTVTLLFAPTCCHDIRPYRHCFCFAAWPMTVSASQLGLGLFLFRSLAWVYSRFSPSAWVVSLSALYTVSSLLSSPSTRHTSEVSTRYMLHFRGGCWVCVRCEYTEVVRSTLLTEPCEATRCKACSSKSCQAAPQRVSWVTLLAGALFLH